MTTQVRDAVTVIHGPKGCTHHNFSLLHATMLENDHVCLPDIISTGLEEGEIIFGGEGALKRTLESIRDARMVFVLSTCLVDTIGDDVAAVCRAGYERPVLHIPTSGFLGGTFHEGVNNALNALAATAEPCAQGMCVNIIGEKNLEFEVDENYTEVCRLLDAIGIPVNMRFIRNCRYDDISRLGAARLNILRDEEVRPVGELLHLRFGTPFIPSFPSGFDGTIRFLRQVAGTFGLPCERAIEEEKRLQDEILADFDDLAGTAVRFESAGMTGDAAILVSELARRLEIDAGHDGGAVTVPFTFPVGTNGICHLLHRWRRAIRAGL